LIDENLVPVQVYVSHLNAYQFAQPDGGVEEQLEQDLVLNVPALLNGLNSSYPFGTDCTSPFSSSAKLLEYHFPASPKKEVLHEA
jgi:hypothetical protein